MDGALKRRVLQQFYGIVAVQREQKHKNALTSDAQNLVQNLRKAQKADRTLEEARAADEVLKERARQTGELLQLQKALAEYDKKHKAVLRSSGAKLKVNAERPKQSGRLAGSWARPKPAETLKKKPLDGVARNTGAKSPSKQKEFRGRC